VFLFKDESDTHFECPSCGQRGSVPSDVLAQTLKETEHVRISCTRCATKFEPGAKPPAALSAEPDDEIGSLPAWLSAPERPKVALEEAPEPEAEPEAEAEPEPEPEAVEEKQEGEPEVVAEPEADAEPEPETTDEAHAEPEPKDQHPLAAAPSQDVEQDVELYIDPEDEPDLAPDTAPDIAPDTEPEAAPEVEPSGGVDNKLQFLSVSLAAILFFLGGLLLLGSR
jgi:transcription elongation factor Elf1